MELNGELKKAGFATGWDNSRYIPNSGTEVTLGGTDNVRGDFSKEGADLEKRFCPDSSTMLGLTLVAPPAELGPQVFPFTPSAGTEIGRVP